jgi:hypothetical protein
MEVNMSADEVLTQIKQLQNNGGPLNKKNVKKSHPELMKSALFYFPSWEHAIQNTEA